MEKEAFLFVYYRGNDTAEEEQIYFSVSLDGLKWEEINGEKPMLRSTKGENGVRDISITRTEENHFIMVATDLSLFRNFQKKYHNKWTEIGKAGSHCISIWETDDLTKWSEQRLLSLVGDEFGCVWNPDIIYDKEYDDYMIYWSSSNKEDDFTEKAIYYSKTKDFQKFTSPQLLYRVLGSSLIDPEIRYAGGKYYRFFKSRKDPFAPIMEVGESLYSDFLRCSNFDEIMEKIEAKCYEGPTFYPLPDGRWCLMLDYFGEQDSKGYQPFITQSIESGLFKKADTAATFPHAFRNGKVISITIEEYDKLKSINK
jgi:hypothetical protein